MTEIVESSSSWEFFPNSYWRIKYPGYAFTSRGEVYVDAVNLVRHFSPDHSSDPIHDTSIITAHFLMAGSEDWDDMFDLDVLDEYRLTNFVNNLVDLARKMNLPALSPNTYRQMSSTLQSLDTGEWTPEQSTEEVLSLVTDLSYKMPVTTPWSVDDWGVWQCRGPNPFDPEDEDDESFDLADYSDNPLLVIRNFLNGLDAKKGSIPSATVLDNNSFTLSVDLNGRDELLEYSVWRWNATVVPGPAHVR